MSAIITVATTGPIATKADNPALPTTPEEIAAEVSAAYLEGAAVAHIHLRDERQLERAVRLARDLDRPVATVAEAESLLALRLAS
jgi:uncharacterized protein (DUF849 family)